jgi:hypothetical protein
MSILIATDVVREPLYAIVPYSNVWRHKSRVKHTQRALKHFHDSGATIVFVEVAFNRREFAFANCGLEGQSANCGILGADNRFKHRHIQLRTTSELWLKENMINIGVQHLPHDWQQLCFLDSDIHFTRPNWVGECIHKLQNYSYLQMFSHARDLAPDYEMLPEDYPHANGLGFVNAWQRLQELHDGIGQGNQRPAPIRRVEHCLPETYGQMDGKRVFPGLAWAATRKAWEDTGGLMDAAIWGGGDWHMSHALIEKVEGMMRTDLHRNYKKLCMQWYHRCRTHIRKNVGFMTGSVLHHWHGRKTQRGYNSKHSLLARVGFDPPRHLKRDINGLWNLHDDRSEAYPKLRDLMRSIARDRNEDGNEI